MASVTEAGLITADEFAELFGPDDRVELVHGKIVNRMAPDPFHGNMVGLLCQMFNEWAENHDDYWIYSESGTILNDSRTTVRCPDLAVMAYADTPTPLERGKFARMTPVLVVEVLSLSESNSDRAQKKQDWFGDGLKQYWEVDLRNFSVRIEQPDGTSQTFLEIRAEIIRNPLGMEGLTIDLKRLFRMVKKLQ